MLVRQWQDDVWENHHCLASNKWWSIDDKMFERIIIIGQTMIKLCWEKHHRLTSNIWWFSQELSPDCLTIIYLMLCNDVRL